MITTAGKIFITACGFSFLTVVLGAFGGHVLKRALAGDLYEIFEVGVRYQMYHALALFVVAWALVVWPGIRADISASLFSAGIVFFSGSLYILALTGTRSWGMVTPVGGLLFLAGWLHLAWEVWRAAR